MTGRIPCQVPGCRRTKAKGTDAYKEWLCPKHWPTVRKQRRRVLSRIHRKGNRDGWTPRLLLHERTIWHAIRREAIERALGL